MVHIMMATYNGERYIAEQIESILKQTYIEWKLFIRDDGSEDCTTRIIQEYMNKYPMKIFMMESNTIYHEAKRNFAALYEKVPEAEYYAFCDQDDIWKENKLQECVSYFQRNENSIPTLIYHDMYVGTDEQHVIDKPYFEYSGLRLDPDMPFQRTLLYNTIPGCAMLFNDKLRKAVKKIPKECNMHDWWMLLCVLALDGNVIYCDEKLSIYRQHAGNEIGVIKKTPAWKLTLKCFEIFRIKYYLNRNNLLKKERIIQTKALCEILCNKISRKNKNVLEEYLKLLKNGRGVSAYCRARKQGLVFENKLYTFKFYLI